jgi:hypothetical protein
VEVGLTRDGDLKWGDDRCNAMHRLVGRWCFNARIVETLFGLVTEERNRKQQAERERDDVASIAFANPEMAEKFRTLGEDIGDAEFGGATCAGAIVVVLNNLLQRYKGDLGGISPKWGGIAPQFNGHSFGEVIEAAAANFRHHDEWMRARVARKFTDQQKKSIGVIERTLGYNALAQAVGPPWARNACADIVSAISESDFAVLERRFFEFAKAMLP